MKVTRTFASATLVTGAVASLTSAAALAVAARVEGKGALRPLNATSHWLHGDEAGAVELRSKHLSTP